MNFDLNSPVLVLNANFEPIHVCNVRRAMGLIFSDKATMVLNGRGVIRTVRQEFPTPSIIRLSYMIKRPRSIIKLNKHEVFRRDNYTCQYCGIRPVRPTLDHVIPRRLGGTHTWENLVTACPSCNHKKGGRVLEMVSMRLQQPPRRPPASAQYLFGRYLNRFEEWGRFIEGW